MGRNPGPAEVFWRAIALAAVVLLGLLSVVGSGGDSASSSPDEKQLPTYASFAGVWRGSLEEATSGSFGETVLTLQQSGAVLSGTWTAWFNSGSANGGTISGSVLGNASSAGFELTSTGLGQCPFKVTVSLQGAQAQGTYASVNCPVLMAGTVHVYQDGTSGPTYVPALPGAPTGVTAIPGNGQVTIRWTKVAGASSYNVYWLGSSGVSPTNGTKVARAGEPVTIPVSALGTYYFVVTAENVTGEGPPSAEVSATTSPAAPNPPTNVTAAPGSGQVVLTWLPVFDATGYNLYWSTNPGGAFSAGARVAGVASPYTLSGLTNGTTYFVALTSTNVAGESAPTAEVRATPYQTFAYGFEAGTLQGWVASGTWAVVSGTGHSGSYAVTDSPGGSYANNTDSWLVSPPIGLAGRYVYVANFGSDNISQFSVDANGALAPMAASTVASGSEPQSVSVHPSGRYVYAANVDFLNSSVSQYAVGPDGALAPLTPASVLAGTGPESVAVDPSGRYAYAANYYTHNVTQYAVDANGALQPLAAGPVAAGTSPFAVTVHPSGKYVYVANWGSTEVSQYMVGEDGSLTPMTPATAAAGTGPQGIAIDPSGKYAYVANVGSNNVSQYSVGLDGRLVPMEPAAVAAGTGPWNLAVDPTGKYVYVANYNGNDISQYTIDASGALVPMAPASVATGSSPRSIAIHASGKYAYVANHYSHDLWQYTIGPAGGLAPMTPATVAAGTNPSAVAADPVRSASPMLTFWHRYELESGYDFGRVEISADAGASWTVLRTISGSQTLWTPETISLRDYSQPAILIRFRLTTDGSGTADGWYLDDIVISR